MRFQFNSTATQKRLATYSGNKAAYAVVSGVSIRGFFVPIENMQKSAALGVVGQGYEFTTDGAKDILVNDILTINSIDYKVAGVARYTMASQDFLKVILQLQKNG